MTVRTTDAPKSPPRPAPVRPVARTLARPRAGGAAALLVLVALLGLACWAFGDLRINVATLTDSASNAVDFGRRMVPLDFPPPGELLTLCAQTLAVVVSATLLSVLLSLPVAVLAAGNTTPHPAARFTARGAIVLARAVPDVVLAIVFFRIFGLGGLTGVLAMGLHSVGMVGKMYADAIEQIDEGPRTAVRATGAGRVQQLVSGVLPQVLPALVANALHRLDINLRVSVVLGFVGVNGLGYAIAGALGSLDYRRGMALALVVLVLCVLVELLSGAIRRALLRDAGSGRKQRLSRWHPAVRAGAAAPVRTVTAPPVTVPGPAARISPPSTARRARRTALVELLSGAIRRALLRDAGSGRKQRLSRWHPAVRAGAAAPVRTVTAPPVTAPDAAARISPPWTARRVRRTTYAAASLLTLAVSIWGADLAPAQFLGALGNLGHTLGLFWPPGTGGILPTLLADLLETVKIALAATLIGAVLALPIGALAARNVSPSPATAAAFRTVVVLVRGVPELVLAIVFVVITGLGAVAGALALGVGAVGLLGKLVADSLEEVDPGVEAAVRATGAARGQVFWSATLPQAASALVGHVLYQLDVNIRSATLLGIVGAGGIGFDLLNASRVLEFGVVTTVLLLVFGTVLLVELLAVWLRRVVR
ncbi:phosphonate ABC transporter, permease protein PhnE [Streptomyces sp. NPDC005866]|uniref:phosphonate ABC transporter, permease protein PhnE n=1 Tax=Streptomyces sp. NPDC005866 TaxID=3157075 RepID=UPI0033C21F56